MLDLAHTGTGVAVLDEKCSVHPFHHVWSHIGTLECHIELGLLALLSPEAQAGLWQDIKLFVFRQSSFFVVSVAIDRRLFFEKSTLFYVGHLLQLAPQ